MLITAIDNSPFGATVANFDCAAFRDADIDALRDALHRHQLLVFPEQLHITPQQEVAFYRSIDSKSASVWRDQINNPWEVYKVAQGNQAGTYQIPEEPGVLVLGKGKIKHYGLKVTLGGERGAYGEDRGSQVLGGGALQWHIDGSFYRDAPCYYTQMRCIEAPAGSGHWLSYDDGTGDSLWCEAGSTAFASGRLGYDELPPEIRKTCAQTRVHYAVRPFEKSYALANSANGLRLSDPVAEQRYRQGEDTPGTALRDPLAQVYPLIWTCPVTRSPALMPQPRCMHALEQSSEASDYFLGVIESRLKLEAWMRPAIAPELVYVHAWQPGDLVIWDNRSLWHSATGRLSRDDRRVMHLTAFNGAAPPSCKL